MIAKTTTKLDNNCIITYKSKFSYQAQSQLMLQLGYEVFNSTMTLPTQNEKLQQKIERKVNSLNENINTREAFQHHTNSIYNIQPWS